MNIDQINKAFEKLLAERGALEKLGVASSDVRSMRYNLNHDIAVSLEKKLEWLQKAGLFVNE